MGNLLNEKVLRPILSEINETQLNLKNVNKITNLMKNKIIQKLNNTKSMKQITEPKAKLLINQYIQISIHEFLQSKLMTLQKMSS